MSLDVPSLIEEITACKACEPHLAAGARPVVQFSVLSRLVIVGQAPSSRVHATGIPWNDRSGDRLREWTGLSRAEFYDPDKVALVPMGFCYPGRGKSGDQPPRRECAPLWHGRVFDCLRDVRLTLLVGSYAQAHCHRARKPRRSLTETVRDHHARGEGLFPLPHPSWRSAIWMRRNPWFESDVLPALRAAVRAALDSSPPLGGEARRGGCDGCNPLSQPLPLAGERRVDSRHLKFDL